MTESSDREEPPTAPPTTTANCYISIVRSYEHIQRQYYRAAILCSVLVLVCEQEKRHAKTSLFKTDGASAH